MKIAFMGTPDFAAVLLRRLFDDNRRVECVFTQPDKPAGRGRKLTPSPVKTLAEGKTEIYQPESLRGGAAETYLRAKNVDIAVVAAYGKLLPPEILALPPLGCVNIHASLLPRYRGAAPIQRAVLDGETETGLTSMYMAESLDTGDIILTKRTHIGETETSGDLFERLALLGADLLSETLSRIENGTAPRVPQDDGLATYAPPLTKSEAVIDWTRTPREVLCHIRGMNPWPGAVTEIDGTQYKIFTARENTLCGKPGDILKSDNDGLTVACGGGSVTILEFQAPGGRRMRAADYLRGHPLSGGASLVRQNAGITLDGVR